VSKVARIAAVVVLALWGLATVHCDLEKVPGFGFLAWCHSQEGSTHQDNDCGDDACSVVESGLYKVEEQTPSVPMPPWVVSFVLPRWEPTPSATVPRSALPNESPPELLRTWQFCYRTALPPRAPSFAA